MDTSNITRKIYFSFLNSFTLSTVQSNIQHAHNLNNRIWSGRTLFSYNIKHDYYAETIQTYMYPVVILYVSPLLGKGYVFVITFYNIFQLLDIETYINSNERVSFQDSKKEPKSKIKL